jgi:hypothetical protein
MACDMVVYDYTGSVELTSYGYRAELNVHISDGNTATITAYHEADPHRAATMVVESIEEFLADPFDRDIITLGFYLDEPGWEPHEDYITFYV